METLEKSSNFETSEHLNGLYRVYDKNFVQRSTMATPEYEQTLPRPTTGYPAPVAAYDEKHLIIRIKGILYESKLALYTCVTKVRPGKASCESRFHFIVIRCCVDEPLGLKTGPRTGPLCSQTPEKRPAQRCGKKALAGLVADSETQAFRQVLLGL